MKKKDLFKINEGLLLFAFGCCLENQPVISLILTASAVLMTAVLFHPRKEELQKTAEGTVLFLLPVCLCGLSGRVPLLVILIWAAVFISVQWNSNAKRTSHDENGIFVICLLGFVLLSFLIKGIFYGPFSTAAVSVSIFGPHVLLCLLDDIKMRKRIVKSVKAY